MAFSLAKSSFCIGLHSLLVPPHLLESPVTEERLSPCPFHRAQPLSSFSWLFMPNQNWAPSSCYQVVLVEQRNSKKGEPRVHFSRFLTTCRLSLLPRKTKISAVACIAEPRERCLTKREPRNIQSQHAEQSSLKGTYATAGILLLAQRD